MILRSALLVILGLSCSVSHAAAADITYKIPVTAPVTEPIEYGNIYFGVDANTNRGLAEYAGVLYAPWGLNTSGLRLSVFGLGGRYRYFDDTPQTFNGRFVSIDALAGYSAVVNNGAVTFAIGANYQDQRVRPADPGNPVQGDRLGFKVQSDFWVNPTEQTLVLGIASFSTAFNTYYSILRFGYSPFEDGPFIGPEFVALGNQRTDQQRAGIHITGIPVANRVRLTISGGWQRERNEKDGGYATANLDFTF